MYPGHHKVFSDTFSEKRVGFLQAETGAVMDSCPLLCLGQKSLRHQGTSVDDQVCGLNDVSTAYCDQFRITRTCPNKIDYAFLNWLQFWILLGEPVTLRLFLYPPFSKGGSGGISEASRNPPKSPFIKGDFRATAARIMTITRHHLKKSLDLNCFDFLRALRVLRG